MSDKYIVRRFQNSDAGEVSELIIKTLRTTNIKDYSEEYIENDVKIFSPEGVIERASWTHFYVIEDNDINKKHTKDIKKSAPVVGQFDMFNLKGAKIADELERLELNGITPIDALNILYKLKEELPN